MTDTSSDKRSAALDGLETDHNGIITSPGRFEGEPAYVPYYVGFIMDGSADDLVFADGATVSVVEIDAEDREAFPELPADARYVALEQSDTGFWSCETLSESGYARLEADAETSYESCEDEDEDEDDGAA